jgi:hypothetical protein
MANVQEIPELLSESLDLTKQYLKQETVEPAKRLGKAAGLGFAAALLFGMAALLGGIAVNRWIIRLLPEGRAWSGLAYVISAAVLIAMGGLIIWLGRRGYEDPGSIKDVIPTRSETGEE